MGVISNLLRKKPSKLVAIVVPMSNRKDLTPEEKISLKHLLHFLGKYDKYMVAPRTLKVRYSGFGIKYFNKMFFGSADAHRKLLLSPTFYKAFADYKYILIYHLDSLVFSDQLTEWCEKDFDYVGAPWIKHKNAPYSEYGRYAGKVGNGGFTLMKIESILKIIYSPNYYIKPSEYWEKYYASRPIYVRYVNFPKQILKRFGIRNNAKWEMSKLALRDGYSIELFWAERGKHYYPDFKIPSVETALKFGFESVPGYCFMKNNYTLPFGCHAWYHNDREFWEPYLLK